MERQFVFLKKIPRSLFYKDNCPGDAVCMPQLAGQGLGAGFCRSGKDGNGYGSRLLCCEHL